MVEKLRSGLTLDAHDPTVGMIWIGIETFPLIAGWFAGLGLGWCRAGGDIAKYCARAALLAALVGLAALLTSTPPALWLTPYCDALSPVPIATMVLVAGGFVVMHQFTERARSITARLAIAALCGGLVAIVFVSSFRECLGGDALAHGLDHRVLLAHFGVVRTEAGEDLDFHRRAILAGAGIGHIDDAAIEHHEGRIRLPEVARKKHRYGRTLAAFEAKHGRAALATGFARRLLKGVEVGLRQDPTGVPAFLILKGVEALAGGSGRTRAELRSKR